MGGSGQSPLLAALRPIRSVGDGLREAVWWAREGYNLLLAGDLLPHLVFRFLSGRPSELLSRELTGDAVFLRFGEASVDDRKK